MTPRCDIERVTEALSDAAAAAAPHLLAAARELCRAGLAFIDALDSQNAEVAPIRQRVVVEKAG